MFRYRQGGRDRGAVLIVILDGNKFCLIQEPSKPPPHYWKFLTGHIARRDLDSRHLSDNQIAADNAVVREAKEETGLDVTEKWRIAVLPRLGHKLYVYAGLADFSKMAVRGQDGEIPRAFTLPEIEELKNFHPEHGPILRMVLNVIHRERK